MYSNEVESVATVDENGDVTLNGKIVGAVSSAPRYVPGSRYTKGRTVTSWTYETGVYKAKPAARPYDSQAQAVAALVAAVRFLV